MPSILSGLATFLTTWRRPTSYVLDERAVSGSMSVDRQPGRASCFLVRITGSPSGSLVIAGTVDGVADTETLAWAGSAGARLTAKQFTASSSLTSTVSGGTLISIEAVGPGGEPQAGVNTTIKSGLPVSVQRVGERRWPVTAPGPVTDELRDLLVPYEEIWTPAEGDLIDLETTGQTYEAQGVELVGGNLRPQHWKVRAMRREGR